MTNSEVHCVGAERHGADWINANQAAVDALTGTSLKPWDAQAKEAIPRVVLRVLDRLRVLRGETWDKEAKRWIPKA
jgi:hypothetical protein